MHDKTLGHPESCYRRIVAATERRTLWRRYDLFSELRVRTCCIYVCYYRYFQFRFSSKWTLCLIFKRRTVASLREKCNHPFLRKCDYCMGILYCIRNTKDTEKKAMWKVPNLIRMKILQLQDRVAWNILMLTWQRNLYLCCS